MPKKRLLVIVALLLIGGAAVAVAAAAAQQPPVSAPAGAIVESPNASAGAAANSARPAVPNAPALQAAQLPVIFQDEFTSGSLSNWQPLQSTPATWLPTNGRLVQDGDANGFYSDEDAVLAVEGVSFGNGILQADVYPTSGSPVGLVFGGNGGTYYRVVLNANMPNSASKVWLEKVTPNGATRLASAPVSAWSGYTLSQWQRVVVTVTAGNISVSVNGTSVLSATDNAYAAGWAGVWTVCDGGAQFDNFRIQQSQ